MRHRVRVSLAVIALLAIGVSSVRAQAQFDVPVRINMGGPELIDSLGRTWLGDPGAGADVLGIRPDDLGGVNAIENWCAVDPLSLELLGYDPADPNDNSIFSTIRWDVGADGVDFLLEIPIADGEYVVNFYFNECCCPARHWKIQIEGEIVEDDVSYELYDIVDPDFPAQGRVGILTYEFEVEDGVADIAFLPCPECPGATDINAIVNAVEIVGGPLCDNQGLDFNCVYDPVAGGIVGSWTRLAGADGYRILKNGQPFGADLPAGTGGFEDDNAVGQVTYTLIALDGDAPFAQCRCVVSAFQCAKNLVCEVSGTEVALTWERAGGLDVTGYQVERNGEVIANLPATSDVYEDEPPVRNATYVVTPVTNPAGQCEPLTCSAVIRDLPFEVPLRINMGGEETVDSLGRTWLGDRPCGLPEDADPLGIRIDPIGGVHSICNWCAVDAASIEKLGFDPAHPGDNHILSTIRWDEGGNGVDFRLEIPVPDGSYLLNLYFNECCCTGRHFQVEVEGEIRDDDVSYLDYDAFPALGKVGRLTFVNVEVEDGFFDLAFLPCPDCPGVNDTNAIINAVELVPLEDPCADENFRQCTQTFNLSVEGDNVVASWGDPLCIDVTGWTVLRDGEEIQNLPGTARSFQDPVQGRVTVYQLVPTVAAGEEACPALTGTAIDLSRPFDIPLRLNMGGRSLVDSKGRTWIGDGSGPGDRLEIRADPASGLNTIENWCVATSQQEADSLQALGLDPFDPNDQAIFNTIRWDVGDDDGDLIAGEIADVDGGDVDLILELPVPNGSYAVNLYFTECCCPARFFQIEIQDDLVEESVSAAEYSESGRLGRTGLFSYDDIAVANGILRIALRPCFDDCFEALDFNAIVDAVEVLPAGSVTPVCPRDLVCESVGGSVSGTWSEGIGVTPDGYEVWRNGERIQTLPGSATEFEDDPPCERSLRYEIVPVFDGESPCPDLRMACTVNQPDCPFDVPLRINMGGNEVVDSQGRLWLGDRPCALAAPSDPLGIRVGDFPGGTEAICDWCVPNDQSIEDLGFDPTNAADRHILSTIRWDQGGDGVEDFFVELPIPEGTYDVNLYFNECCCIARHFKIEINGEIVEEDVSYLLYADPPALAKPGVLSFTDIEVDDVLRIGFLPCPECPGAADNNAIVNAIEVLPTGGPPVGQRFLRGDPDGSGAINITDGIFILNFLFLGGAAPTCVDSADADDSGAVNITDGIFVLNFLFLGGGAPAAPHPNCGVDPTNDALGCATSHPSCR